MEEASPAKLGNELQVLSRKIEKFQALWRGYIFRKKGLKAHPQFSNIQGIINQIAPDSKLAKVLTSLMPDVNANGELTGRKSKKGKKGLKKGKKAKKGKKGKGKESLKDKMASKVRGRGDANTEEEQWKIN